MILFYNHVVKYPPMLHLFRAFGTLSKNVILIGVQIKNVFNKVMCKSYFLHNLMWHDMYNYFNI